MAAQVVHATTKRRSDGDAVSGSIALLDKRSPNGSDSTKFLKIVEDEDNPDVGRVRAFGEGRFGGRLWLRF